MNNKIPDYIKTVVLDSTGEVTKSKWTGTFRVKCVMSHADRFALERIYSQLLPYDAKDISEEVRLRAATIAELSVRVVDGPQWWESTNHGQSMVDSEPLYDLILSVNKASEDWSKELESMTSNESNVIVPKLT